MQVLVELRSNGRQDLRMTMTHIRHRDATDQIDIGISLDIEQCGTLRPLDLEGQ